MAGVAVVLDTDNPDAIVVRNQAWQAAEDRCVALADTFYGPYDSHDCPLVLDKDSSDSSVSPISADGTWGDCSTAELYGDGGYLSPADSYADYYTVGREILLSAGTYHVNKAFYDDLLAHPAWLLDDSARVAAASGGGFELENVDPGDIAYALGLRSDDVFVSINGKALDSWDDVLLAHQATHTASTFTLIVTRGGSSVTLSYVVD